MVVLAGDVGSVNTRLALYQAPSWATTGELPPEWPSKAVREARYASSEHPSLEAIVKQFLAEGGRAPLPARASFAVSAPVRKDQCPAAGVPWRIDARALERDTGIALVRLVNELHAAALGVTTLGPDGLEQLGGEARDPEGPVAVLRCGAVFGEEYLVKVGGRYHVIDGEGGHRDFAARNHDEMGIVRHLLMRYMHVSNERILSGPGLSTIYQYLVETGHTKESDEAREAMKAPDDREKVAAIVRMGLARTDRICETALDLFVGALGAEAGNLALQVLATGGVFLAGGIPPRILTRLREGGFRAAFEMKGRLGAALAPIPAYVVTDPRVGLRGAAVEALRLGPPAEGAHA